MFEHPPAWTHPLANLTSWFDWDALSAIGTVGALWFALWQTTQTARAARIQSAAVIKAILLTLTGPMIQVMQARDALESKIATIEQARIALSEGQSCELALGAIQALKLTDLPSSKSIDFYLEIKASLSRIVASASAQDDFSVSFLNNEIRILDNIGVGLSLQLVIFGDKEETTDSVLLKHWIDNAKSINRASKLSILKRGLKLIRGQ